MAPVTQPNAADVVDADKDKEHVAPEETKLAEKLDAESVQVDGEDDDEDEDEGVGAVRNQFDLLLGPDDDDGQEQAGEEEDDDEDDDTKNAVGNPFDLLLGDDDADGGQGQADDDDEEDEEDAEVVEERVKPKPKASHSKKKGKRRRKGRKKMPEPDDDWDETENLEHEEDGVPASLFRASDDEQLRADAAQIYADILAIHTERVAEAKAADDAYRKQLEASSKYIAVEQHLLSADSELKRLFGAKVVEAERRNEEMEQAAAMAGHGGRRRRRGAAYGKRAGARKRWVLVSPRDGWFSQTPGLCMVPDTEAPPCAAVRYFRYQHEGRYARLQEDYHMCVATHDANNIAQLAAHHPYHVDALLQLAEVYRAMGELDRAAEHTERAMHVLEASWHVAFRPYAGECRLRFEVPENRAFYLALVRYAQLLTRRGLHRTALECAKLVLAQDPSRDPVGALLIIDSLALLASEYAWLVEMADNYKLLDLRHFPNFALSRGLALVELQSKKKKADIAARSESGHDALVDALLAFPDALRLVLAATKDSGGAWSSHWLYSQDSGGVLARLGRIYAERCGLLWAAPRAKAALHRAADAAAKLADQKRNPRVARANRRRKDAEDAFLCSGMYRSLQVADFAQGAPQLNADHMAPDPMPAPMPPAAAAPPRQPPPPPAAHNDAPIGARQVNTGEAIREFMYSLLPWRDVQAAVDESDDRDRERDGQ